MKKNSLIDREAAAMSQFQGLEQQQTCFSYNSNFYALIENEGDATCEGESSCEDSETFDEAVAIGEFEG